jgi:hypothetical protein
MSIENYKNMHVSETIWFATYSFLCKGISSTSFCLLFSRNSGFMLDFYNLNLLFTKRFYTFCIRIVFLHVSTSIYTSCIYVKYEYIIYSMSWMICYTERWFQNCFKKSPHSFCLMIHFVVSLSSSSLHFFCRKLIISVVIT